MTDEMVQHPPKRGKPKKPATVKPEDFGRVRDDCGVMLQRFSVRVSRAEVIGDGVALHRLWKRLQDWEAAEQKLAAEEAGECHDG